MHTANVALVIMAAVSVLEALVLIGLGVGGFLVYRRAMTVIDDLEARQIAPLREKVDAILMDVKSVTARVSHQTERVDHAISGTIGRVDETAEHVKSSVMDKVHYAAGVVRGVRAAIASVLQTNHGPKPSATAAGRL
jgi:hypothetical protein